MTSRAKKRKCHNTIYDRGGEKGKIHYLKGCAMYHKKDRVAMRKESQIAEGERQHGRSNCRNNCVRLVNSRFTDYKDSKKEKWNKVRVIGINEKIREPV